MYLTLKPHSSFALVPISSFTAKELSSESHVVVICHASPQYAMTWRFPGVLLTFMALTLLRITG